MSIPFSQSLRVLRHDNLRFGRWLAWLGLLLLGGWFVWFARAPVPVYERSTTVSLLGDTEAEAIFSPVAAARIRSGQTAHLHMQAGSLAQPAALPATVTGLTATYPDGTVHVQLTLRPTSQSFGHPASGHVEFVEVRVGQYTPVQLFLQAAGAD